MANIERITAEQAALSILTEECQTLESRYWQAVDTHAEILFDTSNDDKRALVAAKWACGLREARWELFSQKCADVWEVLS